jgi:hypothetical protein
VRTRRRLALIAAGTILLVAALELSARGVAFALGKHRGLVLDPVLGWRPVPDVEKRGALWGEHLPARTNSLGWRDKPRTVARTPGRRRALLLGDSYVFGVGVDDGLRVSEALERELPSLEAWNLGVTAYGPDQELILFESIVGQYDPDLVVWFTSLANDVEDVRHSRRYSFAKPWYELDGERLVPHAPAPSLLARLRDASYLTELALLPFHEKALAHDVAPPWVGRDGLPLYAAVARALGGTADEHGKPFVCVVIPSSQPDADARAVEGLRSAGLDPFLLAPGFEAERAQGAQNLLADGHWNAAGHALAARLVAAGLRTRGLVR